MPCRASSRARRRWARWLTEGTWPLIGLPSCRHATSSPREGEHPLRTAGRGRSLQGLEQIGHFHRSLGAVRALLLHRSEEHTSELQSPLNLVCRLLLEKNKPSEPVGIVEGLKIEQAADLESLNLH